MKVIIFSHPEFVHSQSMPRFARMLESEYTARGHQVLLWAPKARFQRLFASKQLSKWAGYVDEFILFPIWVKAQLRQQTPDTLYVFCDQALGPWVPLVRHKPHVVHVHDLLALCSAMGLIAEHGTSCTGKLYQRYIRRGFQQAKNFISISQKTRDDLHRYSQVTPVRSEVVYNGLNYPYAPITKSQAQDILQKAGLPAEPAGMLSHLSGNAWYKNVCGVIHIYAQYAKSHSQPLPLWLIGPKVDKQLQAALDTVPPQGLVRFFYGLENRVLQAVYSLSRAFLFPSLEEGFGWPIIEAQACGCPVITTDAPPMNEIGGPVAFYLPRLQPDAAIETWAAHGASVLNTLLAMGDQARGKHAEQAVSWAHGFGTEKAIEGYLNIYKQVLVEHSVCAD